MTRFTCAAITLFIISATSGAAPVAFKCITAEGTPAADLIVDIEKRTMSWAIQKYTIHAIDDRYISAYQNPTTFPGGEVWVLNRITGDYLRATVFVGWDTAEAARKAIANNDTGRISPQIYAGRCGKGLL